MASVPDSVNKDINNKTDLLDPKTSAADPAAKAKAKEEAAKKRKAAAEKRKKALLSTAADINNLKDQIVILAEQLQVITDCEVLKVLVSPYIKRVTDLIDDAFKEQTKIAENYLPILSLPTTPWGVVKWVKKLVFGTILPQMEAYIKLAVEIIELIQAAQTLYDVVSSLDEKLKQCAGELADMAVEEILGAIADEIGELVSSALTPVFNEIDNLQKELDNVLGEVTEQIDFSSIKNFTDTAASAMASKISAVNQAIATPIPENAYVSNATVAPGGTVKIVDGMVVSAEPGPTPIANTTFVAGGYEFTIENGIITGKTAIT